MTISAATLNFDISDSYAFSNLHTSFTMDSFYGAPRQPPPPPTIRPIDRAPVVPEVSVIDSYIPPRNFNSEKTYDSSIFSKKHVRFQGPHSLQKENIPETLKTAPDLKGKTFRQIYLANVPDRHLDLSIFEPPEVTVPKTNSIEEEKRENLNFPVSKTGFCEERQMESKYPEAPKLQSIENKPQRYRDSPPINFHSYQPEMSHRPTAPTKCTEICTQTEAVSTEIATEPTIKDLFRIIQQQNEQIMLLQRQINNLRTNIRHPEIDPPPETETPKKGLFSFDVKATSFEFSFRPQKLRKNEFPEPKIQEILECDSATNSLHLGDSLEVKDSYVSNAPSIAIEMDNYRSSDEEEPELGATFYNDLMKQVNNALKTARRQSERPGDTRGQAMKAVKQATLQHLKNMGVNLAPIQESSEVTKESDSESDNNQSEVSCAVQQLLMKYLPSDKLTKVVKPQKTSPRNRGAPQQPEFSFATLQYMKKYNLIDRVEERPETAPRILDVTALKLQPKLL